VPASVLQPGQLQLEAPNWHCEQVVKLGVPVQLGTWKRVGAAGSSCAGDLQQICWSQSLLTWHDFGQVGEQKPSQQMLAPLVCAAQSEEDAQAFGHTWAVGFRQSPFELRFFSSAPADRQQISPDAVLQSESAAHPVGQSLAAVQMEVV